MAKTEMKVYESISEEWTDWISSQPRGLGTLKADGRITLMFCAFEGLPDIRLYGRGEVFEPDDERFSDLCPDLHDLPGEQAVVDGSVHGSRARAASASRAWTTSVPATSS